MISSALRPRALARRVFPLFVLLFATILPAGAAVSPPSNAELAGYADQLFSRAYPAGEPGAAVLIAKDGQVLLRKGYGLANLELGVPIEPDMVFELASVTKQFTAAAILLLQERGKLSVNDEITKYLPDYPTHGQKITIHHLLTHMSGIPEITAQPEWWPRRREDLTVQQLLDMFKDKPLDFTPGEKQGYSNSGYDVLGAILEKASGKSYEDFVEQEILAPLGMKRSRYGHRNEVVPGRVAGYDREEDGYRVAEYLSMTQAYAAGGLMSTVDDLALWTDALFSEKLLTKASLERMTAPAVLPSGRVTKGGYGLQISNEGGERIVEHGGGIPGFTIQLLSIPGQRLTVIVLTNSFGAGAVPGVPDVPRRDESAGQAAGGARGRGPRPGRARRLHGRLPVQRGALPDDHPGGEQALRPAQRWRPARDRGRLPRRLLLSGGGQPHPFPAGCPGKDHRDGFHLRLRTGGRDRGQDRGAGCRSGRGRTAGHSGNPGRQGPRGVAHADQLRRSRADARFRRGLPAGVHTAD